MNFKDELEMEQIQDLINTALSNKHNNVERINNMNEYFAASTLNRGLVKLARSFAVSAKAAYKEYLYNLKNKIDNVQLLIDYRVLKQCEEFYYEEQANVWSSINEYKAYLSSSNFIKSLFGYDRRDDDHYE